MLGLLVVALLSHAPVPDTVGAARSAAIRALDVSGLPRLVARAYLPVAAGRVVRPAVSAMRATTDAGPATVVGATAAGAPSKVRLVLVVFSGRLGRQVRQTIAQLEAMEPWLKADSVTVVLPGDSVAARVVGPLPSVTALQLAGQAIPDSNRTPVAAVLGAARAVVRRGGAPPQILAIGAPGASLGFRGLKSLADGVRVVGGELVVAGLRGNPPPGLAVVNAGANLEAAGRRWGLTAPGDSSATVEVIVTVKDSLEGARSQFSIGPAAIAGADTTMGPASVPFLVLAPGRREVGTTGAGPAPVAGGAEMAAGAAAVAGVLGLLVAVVVVRRRQS